MSSKDTKSPATKQFEALSRGIKGICVFLFSMSGLINLLALTGSLYMMQIYDRAIPSGSIPTLLALSLLAIGLYTFQGLFETLRSQILVRVGARLDSQLAPMTHKVAIDMPRFGFSMSEALERGRDVDTLRNFVASQGPMAIFDLPWIPVYLVFIYALHPTLGGMIIAGAFFLACLALLTEVLTRRHAAETHRAVLKRNAIAESNARNSEILRAMGFGTRAASRFQEANASHLRLQTKSNDVSGTFGAISRILRMILQSATLGLGAWLTIKGEMSGGAIIAASIASSRALAPVDMAIGNWKNFTGARNAWARIKDTMVALANEKEKMSLPAPKKSLKVEKITVAAPASGRVLLAEVSFELTAGQALGIIGPSGGGKTTLVRAITGIWPTLRGTVRMDEAELTQWQESEIGLHVGYLPQDVALIDGTVEENISRLDPGAKPEDVVKAAQAAGIHDMIVHLPDGYKTHVGSHGEVLSAGQRQRVGLARALYGDPFIVIMDEPNSNLDGEGETALVEAIRQIRARGGIAIVVAHRPSALAAVELLAVIQAGKMVAFGSKDEIMGKAAPLPAAANSTTPPPTHSGRRRPVIVAGGGAK